MSYSLQFVLDQAVTRLESECSLASSRIQRARTMREVKHAAEVHPAPYIRHLPQCRRQLDDLRNEGEKKMERLLADQLKVLGSSPNAETMKEARCRLLITEWCFLRGTFSRICTKAERESLRLIHAASIRAESTEESPDEGSPAPG